jgi:hypothetical protein
MIQRLFAAAALSAMLLAPAASAQNDSIDFTLTNNTERTLLSLYISLPSTNSWEEDIFGADVLSPGDTFNISINDELPECVYDIKAVFTDSTEIDIRQVDFCELDGAELTVDEN